jgi:uncharacterized membrane protein YeaQ/YmgE (transglycosylase-associated protein family)
MSSCSLTACEAAPLAEGAVRRIVTVKHECLVGRLETPQIPAEKSWLAPCFTRAMAIVFFLLFGLVVGFIARAVMPGTQKMGIVSTMVLGVVGSFVGGFLVALITSSRVTDLNTSGVIGSVVGALILLALMGRRSSQRTLV